MRFINTTGNTVFLSDINKTVTFKGDEEQEIITDEVLKSKSFQSLVAGGQFTITEINNHRIEKNLLKKQTETEEMPIVNPPIEVTIKGHFLNNTGYAKANRNLVYALNRCGVKVGIEYVKESASTLNELEYARIERFRRAVNSEIFIHSTIPSFPQEKKGYSILNTTVEAASVPDQFVYSCNSYDEVWVASSYCKEILTKSGVEKEIYVIPNCLDPRIYNTQAKPLSFSPTLKSYVFLSVFGWNYRKGYDVLLRSYLKEFTKDDDVSLLICTKYQYDNDRHRRLEIDAEIKAYREEFGKNCAEVARCGQEISEMDMPRIYRACNCFVLPSRGEGYGLPFAEAGMCGLPVIATRHSGHTMFLNDENSYLLNVDEFTVLPSGSSNVHYWDNQVFPSLLADNTIIELGRLMRSVYENQQEAKDKSEKLQETMKSYTLDTIGNFAKNRLETICQNLSSR